MYKTITAADWHHLPMPATVAHFTLEKPISCDDYDILIRGYLPKNPNDNWFTYFENGKLHIFRSLSGFCIYIVNLIPEERFLRVTVNRDPKQYVITDVEQDKFLLSDLLDILIRFGGLERQRLRLLAEAEQKRRKIVRPLPEDSLWA